MRGYDSQLAFGVVNLGDTAEWSVGRGSIGGIGRSASSAGSGAGAGGAQKATHLRRGTESWLRCDLNGQEEMMSSC